MWLVFHQGDGDLMNLKGGKIKCPCRILIKQGHLFLEKKGLFYW